MKNIFSAVKLAIVMGIIGATSVFFSTKLALAETCPPGQACSENYTISTPQTAIKTEEKKEMTAEEKKEYQKKVQEARMRDNDKTIIFQKTSPTELCSYSNLEKKIDDLLIKYPDIIIDQKEFLSPSFSIKNIGKSTNTVFSQCTTTVIVHYHKTGE